MKRIVWQCRRNRNRTSRNCLDADAREEDLVFPHFIHHAHIDLNLYLDIFVITENICLSDVLWWRSPRRCPHGAYHAHMFQFWRSRLHGVERGAARNCDLETRSFVDMDEDNFDSESDDDASPTYRTTKGKGVGKGKVKGKPGMPFGPPPWRTEPVECPGPKYKAKVHSPLFPMTEDTWVDLQITEMDRVSDSYVRARHFLHPQMPDGQPMSQARVRNEARQAIRHRRLERAAAHMELGESPSDEDRREWHDFEEEVEDEMHDAFLNAIDPPYRGQSPTITAVPANRDHRDLEFDQVADDSLRDILAIRHESQWMSVDCDRCKNPQTAWWCRDCNTHICRLCTTISWPMIQCPCVRRMEVDRDWISGWDPKKWIAKKLCWAEADEVDALRSRYERNQYMLCNQSSGRDRWSLDHAISMNPYRRAERHKVTQLVLRKHITRMRIDYVLAILDLLLKNLGRHTYWQQTTIRGHASGSFRQDKPIDESARQSWCWWISLARQEISLDRERIVNQIVIGRYLERCARTMEPWIGYRRLTMTCAATYYFDKKDVICITQEGEAVWDIIAKGVKEYSGQSIRDCLRKHSQEAEKNKWWSVLREEYQIHPIMIYRYQKYYEKFTNERVTQQRQRDWDAKYVRKVFLATTIMRNSQGETNRPWRLEYHEKLRRYKLLRKDFLGFLSVTMVLNAVGPHAVRKANALNDDLEAADTVSERRALRPVVKAWGDIADTLNNAWIIAHGEHPDNWRIYIDAQNEYHEAKKKMYDFHLFLPYQTVQDRVWFVRPRVEGDAHRIAALERVPGETDDDVIATHTKPFGPGGVRRWISSEEDADESN